MGCGTGCCKVLLITFNILFWLFGLGLLCIGVWVKVDSNVANLGEAIKIGQEDTNDYLDIASWVFIGAGIFAFIVGFFGCCGSIRESQLLLGFYIVCLIIIFAAEIGIAVVIGMQYPKVSENISKYGSSWVRNSYDGGDSLASKGFNYLQIKFACCGVDDFRDYKGSKFLEKDNQIRDGAYMSYACCKPSNGFESDAAKISPQDREACENKALEYTNSTTIPETNENSVFRAQGCKNALETWAQERLPIFFGVAAGIAFVQIFIFIISVCMCVRIRRDKD